MHFDRRTFLTTAVGASIAGCAGRSASHRAVLPDRPLTKDDLPTPALLLDLDRFESNIRTLADHCRNAGRSFRPHAKTHKCPEIARRQVAAGALGVCAATVAEAEAMAAGGIREVLLTSPVMEPGKFARMAALATKGARPMLALGHARQVEMLSEAARREGVTVDVLIDLDVGDRRTGALPGDPAIRLAQAAGTSKALRVRGIQAYAGHASHVVGFEKRREVSLRAMHLASKTRQRLAAAGFDMSIFSGGSTGTYNIDTSEPGVTELQVGSYVFMGVDYRRIGSRSGSKVYDDFQPSLKVLTTVVSANHDDRVTLDAGLKALDTTTRSVPQFEGRRDLAYSRFGDEFGRIETAPGGKLPALGDRLELIVPHCDPTLNLYGNLNVVRGDRVLEIWPVAGRHG